MLSALSMGAPTTRNLPNSVVAATYDVGRANGGMIRMDKIGDIRKRARGGESIASIARAVGASGPTVRKRARMEGLSPEPPRRREPDAGQRVHGACRCAMHREGLRVGYCPCARYLASVASLAGRHQDSFSRYQRIVSARPATKSV